MKSIIQTIAVFFLLFTACAEKKDGQENQKADTLSVTPARLEYTADEAGSQIVSVETNVANWSITQSVDWLIISRETDRLTVAVQKNKVTSQRTGIITVKAGEAQPATITVVQSAGVEPPVTLSAEPAELEFAADDTEPQTVTVTTNATAWDVHKSASWLLIDKKTDKTFSVTVERNKENAERQGAIIVTTNKAEPVTIVVKQLANDKHDWISDPNLRTLKAFPEAEGFGANTTGGRGGRVLYVTRLDDDTNSGSLRWAINQTGARIIMFKVAGHIRLNSKLNIRNGDLTIAGHSAPGDGICISGYDVTVDASNVIIRYMRFRMGDLNNVESDAIWGRYQRNVILDHCSMSWSIDECASFYENQDFTMQWCILSESLRVSSHEKGAHGYGGIWGGRRASFHHNLLAHHDSRNPRFGAYTVDGLAGRATGLVDFRNNVIYNWGGNSGYGGEGGNYNMVNNYYQPGASTSNNARIFHADPDAGSGIHGVFYLAGNVMMNPNGTVNTTVTNNNWNGFHTNASIQNPMNARSDTEFEKSTITTHTAQEAYQLLLTGVGASLRRDATDLRVIHEVQNRLAPMRASRGTTRGGLIDSQNDVGGWATYAFRSEDVPVDTDGDGIPDEWETY